MFFLKSNPEPAATSRAGHPTSGQALTAQGGNPMQALTAQGGNPAQAQAIAHKDGPMMVLAGPGSGKTYVIVQRLRHMTRVHGIPPEEILVITFTKAAAAEMQARYEAFPDAGMGVTFGTFHAVYFHILQTACHYRRDDILTKTQKHRYMKAALAGRPRVDDDEATLDYLVSLYSKIKNDGLSVQEYLQRGMSGECLVEPEDLTYVLDAYAQTLSEEHKLDFDDMVLKCRDLFLSHPDILALWQDRYRYVLIDEFQDINPMQYEVIRMLAAPQDNLFIVGDDDQSIYGFRGSEPGIMLRFPRDYPRTRRITLQENYRSSQGIVDCALRLVGNNRERYAKRLRAQQRLSHDVTLIGVKDREQQAAQAISLIRAAHACMDYRDVAILLRTNASARYYSQKLSEAGIPFYLREKASSVYAGRIGRVVLSMCAFADGARSRENFLRFMNRPQRYISRSIVSEGEVDVYALSRTQGLKDHVAAALHRLAYDLEKIGQMCPYAAVNYIRKGVGLEGFLVREARSKGQDTAEICDTLDQIQEGARSAQTYREWEEQVEAYEATLRGSSLHPDCDGVQLITMHASKGLEYRMVLIPDVNEGVIPQKKAQRPEEVDEERRLLYVAMTRAKERLILLYLKKNLEEKTQPSRFLKELALKTQDASG